MARTDLIPVRESLTAWDRLKRAVALARRSYNIGPLTLQSPELVHAFGNGRETTAGLAVSEWTALNYSTFFSAVNLVSSDIAARPLELIKRGPNGIKDRQTTTKVYRLLHDQPNPECTSMQFRRVIQAHAMTWGGGFAEIERDGAARPVALWPLTPDRVHPFRRSADAPLQYRVLNPSGSETFLDAQDVLHIRGLGWDTVTGYNIVQKARESIGLSIAAEQFGAGMYGNGLNVSGVISYPSDPDERVKKENRETLQRRHAGVQNAHKLLALYGGAKFETISIPPNLAQFLETRQFQVSEIARWFNIPPHKLAELSRSTNNNIEQQTIDYYTMTLLPWYVAWEEELESKLISPLERNQFYIKHNVAAILRADAVGRAELYSKLLLAGGTTPNRVAELEDQPMIDGGDDAFVPLNSIPLPLARGYFETEIAYKRAQTELTQAQAKKLAEPPPPQPIAPADPNAPKADALQRDIERLSEEVALARRATQAAEDKRDLTLAELATVQEQRIADGKGYTDALAAQAADVAAARTATAEAVLHTQALVAERDRALSDRRAATERALAAEALADAQRQTALTAEQAKATADAALARVAGECDLLREQIGTVTSERDVIAEQAREALVAVAASQAQISEADAERDRLLSDLSTRTTELATMVATLTETEHARDAHAADVARLTGDVERARAEVAEVSTELAAVERTAAERSEQLARAVEAAEAAGHAIIALTAERDEAIQRKAATEAAMTALDAVIVELRARIESVETSEQSAREQARAAEALRITAESRAAAADADVAEKIADLLATQDRLVAAMAPIRTVFVDALQRIVIYESERARKQAATPDKLTQWIDRFYPNQDDACRKILRPAVRAWLALHGKLDAVDAAVDALVVNHIQQSVTQLRAMVEGADAETLPSHLERLLRRWEDERAEVTVDLFLGKVA